MNNRSSLHRQEGGGGGGRGEIGAVSSKVSGRVAIKLLS